MDDDDDTGRASRDDDDDDDDVKGSRTIDADDVTSVPSPPRGAAVVAGGPGPARRSRTPRARRRHGDGGGGRQRVDADAVDDADDDMGDGCVAHCGLGFRAHAKRLLLRGAVTSFARA